MLGSVGGIRNGHVFLCIAAAIMLSGCDVGGRKANAEQGTAPRKSEVLEVRRTVQPGPLERHELVLGPGLEPEERANLSGAACSPSGTCLMIGDEMRFARLFQRPEGVLTPADRLFLLPARSPDGKKTKESDGEGIAYDDGYFYVIGSHSANKKGEPQPSRHFIARIPVDPRTGRPADLGTEDRPARGLQVVNLDYLLAADPLLSVHGGERPGEGGEHGPNIEGIAVRAGFAFVGFRGPVDEAGAVLYRLPVEALFHDERPMAAPIRLRLETGDPTSPPTQGVRDLATVSDGLLILSGAEMRADRPDPALWHRSEDGRLQLVARLGDFGGDSPEAIAVLAETERNYQLLVLSDGDNGSAPVILDVAKPGSDTDQHADSRRQRNVSPAGGPERRRML